MYTLPSVIKSTSQKYKNIIFLELLRASMFDTNLAAENPETAGEPEIIDF